MASVDEAFSYRTTRRLPRWEPRVVKLAVTIGVALIAVGAFGRWVSDSENASFARLRAMTAAQSGAGAQPPASAAASDAQAQVSAVTALEIAQRALSTSVTFADASPDALNSVQSALSFQLSPSTTTNEVSMAATDSAWAAAVYSSSGTCYYVRLAAKDQVTYGTGSECSGQSALSADGTSWLSQATAVSPDGFARFGSRD